MNARGGRQPRFPLQHPHDQERSTMSIKKDHSIGEGTGAAAGAVTGAAIGSVAGPVGTVVGAVAGGALGAKAGGSITEAVNPTEYSNYFETNYKSTPYYSS